MKIEEDIFKTYIPNEDKPLKYGLIKEKGQYKYSVYIMDNTFKVHIIIENDRVYGKIYDLEAQREYTNFTVKDRKELLKQLDMKSISSLLVFGNIKEVIVSVLYNVLGTNVIGLLSPVVRLRNSLLK